jgi:hypothetical protein
LTEIYLPWVYPTRPSAPLTFESFSEGLPEAGNVGFGGFPWKIDMVVLGVACLEGSGFRRFKVWRVQGLEDSGFGVFKVGLKQG